MANLTCRSMLATVVVAGWVLGTHVPARADEPIYVAMSTPLSGNAAYLGDLARSGALLAVKEVNAAGGIDGRQVVLDVEDNRCNPTEAIKGVGQILERKRYSFILDGMCSSVALALMPLAERAKVPYISSSALSPAIPEKAGIGGMQWTFVTQNSEARLADAIVGWLEKDGKIKNIAFVGDDSDFARGGASAYEAALKKRGTSFASSDFYQPGTADFAGLFTRLRAKKPDSLLLYAYGADYQNVIRQWYSFARTIPLTARLVLEQTPKEIVDSGRLEGVAIAQSWDVEIDTPENKRFVDAYKQEYGKEPLASSYSNYEGMRVGLDALKRAGSSDPSAVREALKSAHLGSLTGGVFKFDEYNTSHNRGVILVMKGSKLTVGGFFDN